MRNFGPAASFALGSGNLLRGDLPFPRLVLRAAELDHNVELMADWCRAEGVSLAPHAKTTMAPYVIERQLAAGAWGMTVATVEQAAALDAMEVARIVIANEVVDRAGLAWLRAVAERDSVLPELVCLVDSDEGVALMQAALDGIARPLPVLLELGVPGGRAGVRDDERAVEVARAVAAAPALRLAGVECFEGILGATRSAEEIAAVDALLDRVGALAARLEREGLLDPPRGEVIVTAGGSAFQDRVAALRARLALDAPVRVVVRSGCYVTHDHGVYDTASPWGREAREQGAERVLKPALELWAEVISRPEPGLAIVGFGRRDAPYDAGLPVPLRAVARGGGGDVALGPEAAITALNDHHAFLADPGEAAVGDLVACGVSHPCSAFDRWRELPVVDAGYDVVALARVCL